MTVGYEPHQTLWNLFHHGYSHSDRFLTEPEKKEIKGIVSTVVEEHEYQQDSTATLLSRFAKLVQKEGRRLDPYHAELTQGLLQCLNPYQEGTPYTSLDPDCYSTRTGGIFDHFKGGVYLVTGYSTWASGNGERIVEYLSMTNAQKFTRLGSQWCEVVEWPDKRYRSRFVYRGPDLIAPEPTFKVPSPELLRY